VQGERQSAMLAERKSKRCEICSPGRKLTLPQCNYEKENPSSPCVYCHRARLPCGPKRYAPARELSQIRQPGEYTPTPQSPDANRSPRLVHQQNPNFTINLQDATAWHTQPAKLSDLARQLEMKYPHETIYEILERANKTVNPEARRLDVLQSTVSMGPSIQETPPGSANLQATSPFNLPRSSGSTQEQRRLSVPPRLSFTNNQWGELSQADPSQGSSSDNSIPGSIQNRRLSQPQGSPQQPMSSRQQASSQHQVAFRGPAPADPQGTLSPAVSFNQTSHGNTPVQVYQQSQPPFQAQHPSSSQNLYSSPLVPGQHPHGDNQNPALSSPGIRSPVPNRSPTEEENSVQTIQGQYTREPPN
jgi:hypothetical protein